MIPDIESSVLVLIDVQEKFAPAMPSLKACMPKMSLLLSAAKEMRLPVVATEQYPKGLGRTLPELACLLPEEPAPIEKSSFSCFGSDAFRKELGKYPKKSVIVIGVETHVCVQQTALHAIERGYEVFVAADAVASRNEFDRDMALAFMQQAGVRVSSAESILFMLLKDSAHPAFKAVSKLVR